MYISIPNTIKSVEVNPILTNPRDWIDGNESAYSRNKKIHISLFYGKLFGVGRVDLYGDHTVYK